MPSSAIPPPPGVYVPVITFFESASASSPRLINPPVDLETQVKHALFLAKAGIKGLVLLGSSGEAIALSNAERRAIITSVRRGLDEAGFNNYPLIAGTATQGIEDTVLQLQEAAVAGAQWGMVLAPGYFAGSVGHEGLSAWFEAIADLSPIPILV